MPPPTDTAESRGASYARRFNRFELKYVLPLTLARSFAASVQGYLEHDPHSGPDGYQVHSVYWDSADLRFFWEKLDGQKFRRKLRFRTYGERAPQAVFVEIKQRIDRTVQKRRVRWPLERVRALFGQGAIDPTLEAEVEEPEAAEALALCRQFDLRPTMAVRYRRRAWTGAFEADLRLTIDSFLRYDRLALDPGEPFQEGKALLDPRLAILEVKYTRLVPLWLVRALQERGLETTRISKYCAAVDRELFGGRYS